MLEQPTQLSQSTSTARIQHVFQRQGRDCGVACVAMVASVSYDVALAAFDTVGSNGRHTRAIDLQRALAVLGVQTGVRLRGISKRRVEDVTVDAILKVNSTKSGFHWVVWDTREKVVLDPIPRPKLRYCLSAYLPVVVNNGSGHWVAS